MIGVGRARGGGAVGGGWSAAGALSADRIRTKFPALILYLIIGNTVDYSFNTFKWGESPIITIDSGYLSIKKAPVSV